MSPNQRPASSVEVPASSSAIDIDRARGVVVVGVATRLHAYRVTEASITSHPTSFTGSETRSDGVLGTPAHADRIDDVAIAGGRVFSISKFELRVWNLTTGKELLARRRPLKTDAMIRVDATPAGWVLLSGHAGAELWDLSSLVGR